MNNTSQKGFTSLSVAEVKKEIENEIIFLDTRPPQVFVQGFIPGSINLALETSFSEWAGPLVPTGNPVILVTDPGSENESVTRLEDAGIGGIIGYLEGGYETWKQAGEPIDLIIEVEADELAMDIPFDDNLVVLDVRQPAEFAEGHVKDARNLPLKELSDVLNMATLEEEQNVYIHSGTGCRGVVAASLLKRQGIHNIRHVAGGWTAIREESRIETEKDSSKLN